MVYIVTRSGRDDARSRIESIIPDMERRHGRPGIVSYEDEDDLVAETKKVEESSRTSGRIFTSIIILFATYERRRGDLIGERC